MSDDLVMISHVGRTGWLSKRALLRGGPRALKYNVKNSSRFFSAFSRDNDNGSPEEGAYFASTVGKTGDEEKCSISILKSHTISQARVLVRWISDISGYSPKNKSRVGHSAGGLEDFPGLQESLIDDDLDDLPIDLFMKTRRQSISVLIMVILTCQASLEILMMIMMLKTMGRKT